MPSTTDVWEFSDAKVANKGVFARIGHSARLHSVRSAMSSKGSAASKGLALMGVGLRGAASLIPIPIIGSLISSAQAAIEGAIRTHHHTKKLTKNGPVTQADFVKFSLKDISVANLDRYRFKVTDSVEEMTRVGNAFDGKYRIAASTHAPCNADLEYAMAIAQAERRLKIFEDEVAGLLVILNGSAAWAVGARTSIIDYKNQASQKFSDYAQAELNVATTIASTAGGALAVDTINGAHSGCNEFCRLKEQAINTNWDSFRADAAKVVKTLQEPFSPESFLTLNKSSFESASVVENY
jgi:hypothetical protein